MALGQMCWYLQEVGQEAGVIWWRGWWWGWWRQWLLQAVSLGAQSPRHHVGIGLREGVQDRLASGPCCHRPRAWVGVALTTLKDNSWCKGSWGR